MDWKINPRWWIIINASLCLFLSRLCASVQTCSLYESATGMVCFHGNEVTKAITNSNTSWVVEFYSSWCGHCQRLAPTWQELAQNIKAWSPVVQLGVMDCSRSENYQTCSGFHVRAYPSVRFFHPYEHNPQESTKQHSGARGLEDLKRAIVDHVESASSRPLHWPNLQPFVNDKLLSLPSTAWTPTVLVFEDEGSYLGKELILDFCSLKSLTVTRVSRNNVALVKHYSILEFPSIVFEIEKDKYHVISGHTFSDPRAEFMLRIKEHVTTTAGHPSRLPPSHGGPQKMAIRHDDTTHSLTKITRVDKMDLLSAISYAFRMEVPLHNIISGSAFTALMRFVYLLESAFRSAYPAIADNLCGVRMKLELRQSTGFILSRDWNRIVDTKLDPDLFPKESNWGSCLGSKPQYRGYPCSLWTLMHTVTILTLPVKSRLNIPAKNRVNSKEALYILSGFITNFFSCEYCQEHFTAMAQSLTKGVIHHNGDAVMWLWEAHNTVNKRLRDDVSSDPLHPKMLFPPSQMCPYCYTCSTSRDESISENTCTLKIEPSWNNTGFMKGESLLHMQQTEQSSRYVWNRTAVLLFLWNFYHVDKSDSSVPAEILRVAWPKKFDNVKGLHEQYYSTGNDLGLNGYDVSLCVVYYMMCVLCLAMVTFWLLRKRRLRFFVF